MEPTTITLSATVVGLPLIAKAVRPICRFLFGERPSATVTREPAPTEPRPEPGR